MIAGMAGKFVFGAVQKELVHRVATGEVGIYGSVLRALRSGEVVGYAQETAAMVQVAALSNPATVPAAAATLAASLGHSIFDTQRTAQRIDGGVNRIEEGMGRVEAGIGRIEDKLAGVDEGIGQASQGIAALNDLGLANLAMSAAGIGVSVAGFAVVSAKIDGVRRAVEGVSHQIEVLSANIEAIRQDMIEADFSELRSLAKLMDEGWALSDEARAAKQWHEVAFQAQKLQDRFEGRAHQSLVGPEGYLLADPMLDAFALSSGLRVAALAACNETAAACRAADEGSRTLQKLTASRRCRHRSSETGGRGR